MSNLVRLYQNRSFRSPDSGCFVLSVEQSGDQWFIMQHPSPFYEQDFPPAAIGGPFRWEETAVDAANRFAATGKMPERTKFSVRQLPTGEWLVFNAISARYGIGVHKFLSPAPGYTTGAQYGRHPTEAEALAHARQLAHDCDGVVVEWSHPAKNTQFANLPRQYPERTDYDTFAEAEADGWICISPSKTLHIHRGKRIYVRDSTPGAASFGYESVVCVEGATETLVKSESIWADRHFSVRFRSGDIVDAIERAIVLIDWMPIL